jgi:hypothetical protein
MTSLINASCAFAKNFALLSTKSSRSYLTSIRRQMLYKTKMKINSLQVNSKSAWSNRKLLIGLFGTTGICATVYCSKKFTDPDNISNFLNKLLRWLVVANCKEVSANRLKHYAKTNEKNEHKEEIDSDDQFDWLELLKMLYKEKLYFIAAVVVCKKPVTENKRHS